MRTILLAASVILGGCQGHRFEGTTGMSFQCGDSWERIANDIVDARYQYEAVSLSNVEVKSIFVAEAGLHAEKEMVVAYFHDRYELAGFEVFKPVESSLLLGATEFDVKKGLMVGKVLIVEGQQDLRTYIVTGMTGFSGTLHEDVIHVIKSFKPGP